MQTQTLETVLEVTESQILKAVKGLQDEKKEILEKSLRFSTAPWYSPGIEVLVIGLGGIGSWVSMFLGRQDCELHLFDYDMYEIHNQGGQFCGTKSLGTKKTEGTKELILEFSQNSNVYLYEKYIKDSLSTNYVFCGPDNMEARKIAFENWVKYMEDQDHGIFVEAGLSAENFGIHFVQKKDIQRYRKYLYSEDSTQELPCNFKSTSHCGAMCAGLMVSGFNNYISNLSLKEDIREVPFEVQVQLSSFSINVK